MVAASSYLNSRQAIDALQSERIGDYNYTRKSGGPDGDDGLVIPLGARRLLRLMVKRSVRST